MQPFAIFYFSLNASKTIIFMKGLKGQSKNMVSLEDLDRSLKKIERFVEM